MEKETIDGDELRELLERPLPGPKSVPGSLARPAESESTAQERWGEIKGAGG